MTTNAILSTLYNAVQKIPHCPDDHSHLQAVIQNAHGNSATIPELVDLFDRLGSSDPLIVQKANEEIEILKKQDFCLDTILRCSLPLNDIQKLKAIAVNDAYSTHSLLQDRALRACQRLMWTLFDDSYAAGHTTAALLASDMMENADEEVQKRGLEYFTLLFNDRHRAPAQSDLVLAIGIAERACAINPWDPIAHRLFNGIVKHGNEDAIRQLQTTLLDLCSSDNDQAVGAGFSICEKIAWERPDLAAIPLQAAISACDSWWNPYQQSRGFDLFWTLLYWNPELVMPPLLQALEKASKNPPIGMFQRLKELAGHDFSNLSATAKKVILKRAITDAPALWLILTNVCASSGSAHLRQEAQQLKELVEQRLKQSQSD